VTTSATGQLASRVLARWPARPASGGYRDDRRQRIGRDTGRRGLPNVGDGDGTGRGRLHRADVEL